MCNNYCIRCACKVPVFFGHRRVLIEHNSIKTTVDIVERKSMTPKCMTGT